jgi:hypothetical protein
MPYHGDELEEVTRLETIQYDKSSKFRNDVGVSVKAVTPEFALLEFRNKRERSMLTSFSGAVICVDARGTLHIIEASIAVKGGRPEFLRFAKVRPGSNVSDGRCAASEFDLERATFGLYE